MDRLGEQIKNGDPEHDPSHEGQGELHEPVRGPEPHRNDAANEGYNRYYATLNY
jgi:hypothetical protein